MSWSRGSLRLGGSGPGSLLATSSSSFSGPRSSSLASVHSWGVRRRVEADRRTPSIRPAPGLSQGHLSPAPCPAPPHRLLTCSRCSGAQVCHSARAQRRPRVTAHTPWGFSTPELKATRRPQRGRTCAWGGGADGRFSSRDRASETLTLTPWSRTRRGLRPRQLSRPPRPLLGQGRSWGKWGPGLHLGAPNARLEAGELEPKGEETLSAPVPRFSCPPSVQPDSGFWASGSWGHFPPQRGLGWQGAAGGEQRRS